MKKDKNQSLTKPLIGGRRLRHKAKASELTQLLTRRRAARWAPAGTARVAVRVTHSGSQDPGPLCTPPSPNCGPALRSCFHGPESSSHCTHALALSSCGLSFFLPAPAEVGSRLWAELCSAQAPRRCKETSEQHKMQSC